MRRFACIALIGTPMLVPASAMAADAAAQFEVMPPGAVSCASWTLGRDEAGRGYTVLLTEEGVLRAEREGWVAGYISALNVEILPGDRGATRDLTAGVARDEIMAAIDDYCAENPLHSLLSATASVSLELANAWLAAHPASGATGEGGARLPTAGLAPADRDNSVVEEVAPPEAAPPPESPSTSLPEMFPLPPPVPAATSPAPPAPLPAPTPTPPPTAAPVPDSSEPPPLAAAALSEPLPATPPPAPTGEPAPTPQPELRGAVSALSGGAVLQIGAYRASAVAMQAWQEFLVEHRELVADLVSDIQEVNLDASGVWHRLRIGPFPDADAANALCTTLKARGADCFAVVP